MKDKKLKSLFYYNLGRNSVYATIVTSLSVTQYRYEFNLQMPSLLITYSVHREGISSNLGQLKHLGDSQIHECTAVPPSYVFCTTKRLQPAVGNEPCPGFLCVHPPELVLVVMNVCKGEGMLKCVCLIITLYISIKSSGRNAQSLSEERGGGRESRGRLPQKLTIPFEPESQSRVHPAV